MKTKPAKTKKTIAYCLRNGVIAFGTRVPKGALPFLSHTDARLLESFISVHARLAADNKTLLVPGLPEAQTLEERLDALSDFQKRILARFHPSEI